VATSHSPQGGVIAPCLSNIFLHHVLEGRVEQRLRRGRGRHVYDWFEPEAPRIPPQQ
jgi:hypothetical protein